jgi:hypothetical protein
MSSLTFFTNAAKCPPVPRTIKYEGKEYTFLVKKLNAGEAESVGEKAYGVGDKKGKKAGNFRSRWIASAILDEDGTDRFSLNIVIGWPNDLANAVFAEVAEVNNLTRKDDDDEDDAGEASPETTDSD